MGYQVYEDRDARDWGIERWAGYGVPAECDWPDCEQRIDRGLGYKCETHTWVDDGGDDVVAGEDGCGLFFCEAHRYRIEEHERIDPKPDSIEWVRHMLTDDSWQQWRDENPQQLPAMRARAEASS